LALNVAAPAVNSKLAVVCPALEAAAVKVVVPQPEVVTAPVPDRVKSGSTRVILSSGRRFCVTAKVYARDVAVVVRGVSRVIILVVRGFEIAVEVAIGLEATFTQAIADTDTVREERFAT
jgi:hypothetical protein